MFGARSRVGRASSLLRASVEASASKSDSVRLSPVGFTADLGTEPAAKSVVLEINSLRWTSAFRLLSHLRPKLAAQSIVPKIKARF